MYHIKNDKRAQASTELICAELLACMKEKPFARITITDVQHASTVSRSTFYRNFDCLEDVLALLCDSTNVERQGYTPSEKTVAANFERQFSGCNKRIIVTTFASNAFRLQSLIATAKKFGRKVAVTGRSMENILKVATELDYLHLPENTLVDLNQIKSIPKDKLVIVSTGSQGEDMSALYRMARGDAPVVVTTAAALVQRCLSREVLLAAAFSLEVGARYDVQDLCRRLTAAGYTRTDQVEGPGQFALRGGILDVFSPGEERPLRCEFFDDELDSLGEFETATQRRVLNLSLIHISEPTRRS